MKDLNYKKNKLDYEITCLKQKKEEYLDNVEKNKISKKKMITYPLLPIIMGVIGCGVYAVVFKTLPPMEIYSAVGVSVLALECIFSSEEIEQIIDYKNSKKILEETNLQQIENEISLKEQEKIKTLDEKTKEKVNNFGLSNNNPIFNTRDMYLDNTMHFLEQEEDKVLVKKK